MTFDGAAFGAEIVEAVEAYVARAVKPLEERIAQLEAQHKEFHYCGVWREGSEYCVGNFATSNGSLWHCEQVTRSRPGSDSTWKLVCKQGLFHDAR